MKRPSLKPGTRQVLYALVCMAAPMMAGAQQVAAAGDGGKSLEQMTPVAALKSFRRALRAS